ncbi:MAG: hypothetical protein ACI9XZ_004287 [Alphaproteobacteria bacterium]|jgi:hypothetical protein
MAVRRELHILSNRCSPGNSPGSNRAYVSIFDVAADLTQIMIEIVPHLSRRTNWRQIV